MDKKGMVIVGAGEAGARAAAEFRARGWTGEVTLIGEERHAPYERPPLSKNQLVEANETDPVTILNEDRLEQLNIAFVRGDGAVRIDRANRAVVLASGREVPYGKLLLATGARSRKLAVAGDAADDLHYLRTYADALRLRERLTPGARVAIIGGGFIGLEVAASAVANGCEVTLVEVAPRILMRGVPEPVAAAVAERHREAGVSFRVGVMIDSVNRDGEAYEIRLADGTSVGCDVVVAGVGAVPETTLAAACGLAVDNGIQVDERLRTSDPDIYAAGDCCSFPHPLYGGKRMRLEAWRNAQDQGTHAAGSLLGDDEAYAAVPWFWSDQYDLTLQVAGMADPDNAIVVRDLGEAGKLYFHLDGEGRLVSVSGIGPTGAFAKEFRLAEMLVGKRARPAAEELADPDVRLKGLLKE